MPIAPVRKLKKNQIIWLADHRCRHNHTFLDHYSCFLKEIEENGWVYDKENDKIPIPHNIGYLDIEASNLKANFGIMFGYCIKHENQDKISERWIKPTEVRNPKILDKNVVKQCVKDILKFDRVIGFYSTRFDIPFIRTRAQYWGIPFPRYKQLYHTDVYYMVRYKFCLSSNGQQSAYNQLVGPSHKTHFGRDHWTKALAGDKEALKYIREHCQIDVSELEELHHAIEDFSLKRDLSI